MHRELNLIHNYRVIIVKKVQYYDLFYTIVDPLLFYGKNRVWNVSYIEFMLKYVCLIFTYLCFY